MGVDLEDGPLFYGDLDLVLSRFRLAFTLRAPSIFPSNCLESRHELCIGKHAQLELISSYV